MDHNCLIVPELYCTDLKESLHFYCDNLGFVIDYQRPEDGFAHISREGISLMLEVARYDSERTWLPAPLERPFGRGINLQITVRQVDELYARLGRAGIAIFWPIEDKWYRVDAGYVGNRQFVIQDPDGYLLRFAQDLGSRTNVD